MVKSSNAKNRKRDTPDGIETRHVRPRGKGIANPLSLIVVGLVPVAAFAGVLGGWPYVRTISQAPAASLELQAPSSLRNGEFFELRASIVAHQPVADATFSIPKRYWQDVTINTMIPAPAEEESDAQAYRFRYGPLEAGDVLTIKFDGQINPHRFGSSHGVVMFSDGERPLLTSPVKLRVLP